MFIDMFQLLAGVCTGVSWKFRLFVLLEWIVSLCPCTTYCGCHMSTSMYSLYCEFIIVWPLHIHFASKPESMFSQESVGCHLLMRLFMFSGFDNGTRTGMLKGVLRHGLSFLQLWCIIHAPQSVHHSPICLGVKQCNLALLENSPHLWFISPQFTCRYYLRHHSHRNVSLYISELPGFK